MDLCCAKDPNPLKKNKECTVRFRKHGKENLFTLSVSQLSVGAGNT